MKDSSTTFSFSLEVALRDICGGPTDSGSVHPGSSEVSALCLGTVNVFPAERTGSFCCDSCENFVMMMLSESASES